MVRQNKDGSRLGCGASTWPKEAFQVDGGDRGGGRLIGAWGAKISAHSGPMPRIPVSGPRPLVGRFPYTSPCNGIIFTLHERPIVSAFKRSTRHFLFGLALRAASLCQKCDRWAMARRGGPRNLALPSGARGFPSIGSLHLLLASNQRLTSVNLRTATDLPRPPSLSAGSIPA
jgi:hypothetical protein